MLIKQLRLEEIIQSAPQNQNKTVTESHCFDKEEFIQNEKSSDEKDFVAVSYVSTIFEKPMTVACLLLYGAQLFLYYFV